MNSCRRGFAALVFFSAVTALAPAAHAESGRFNLHFSGLGPLPSAGEASVDWQLAQPFAIEARAGGGVVTPFTQRCIVLPPALVLDGIEFEFARADILPSSEETLEGAARVLTDNPDARVEIGGHTDDVGTVAVNEELSLARASSVRAWLVRHGIAASRLEVRGYGASRPRAPNTDDASRAMNRRIEFRQID